MRDDEDARRKKLRLDRQTLRTLSGAELARLAGAGKPLAQSGAPKPNVWTATVKTSTSPTATSPCDPMSDRHDTGHRLRLHRETLRRLASSQLDRVAGGDPQMKHLAPKSNVWTADDGADALAYCKDPM